MIIWMIILLALFTSSLEDQCYVKKTLYRNVIENICCYVTLEHQFVYENSMVSYYYNIDMSQTKMPYLDICVNVTLSTADGDYPAAIASPGECVQLEINSTSVVYFFLYECSFEYNVASNLIGDLFVNNGVIDSNSMPFMQPCSDGYYREDFFPIEKDYDEDTCVYPNYPDVNDTEICDWPPSSSTPAMITPSSASVKSVSSSQRSTKLFPKQLPPKKTVELCRNTSPHPFASSTPSAHPTPLVNTPPLPQRPVDCNETEITQIYCQLLNDSSSTGAQSALNKTKQSLSMSGNVRGSDVYYTGAIVFTVTQNSTNLDQTATTSVLNIINIVSSQQIDVINSAANRSEGNSLLWFVASFNDVILKADYNVDYTDTRVAIKTISAASNGTESICDNPAEFQDFCFDGTTYVSDVNRATVCLRIPIKDGFCKNQAIRMSVSLLHANLYGKTPVFDSQPDNQNSSNYVSTGTIDKCECKTVLYTQHVASASGADQDQNYVPFNFEIIYKRSKTANDLHRKPVLIKFRDQSFSRETHMDRDDSQYQGTCVNSSQGCIIVMDGCSSDPGSCIQWFSLIGTVIGVILAVGLLYTAVQYSCSKHAQLPVCLRCLIPVVENYFGKQLSTKTKIFKLIYDATFFLYYVLMLLFGNNFFDKSQSLCKVVARVNYFLYIMCVLLTVINLWVLTAAVGGWKPGYNAFINVLLLQKPSLSAKEKVSVIRSLSSLTPAVLIPAILTVFIGQNHDAFYQRNDNLCWVRQDYKFLSLWLPLIFLFLGLPFYFPIILRILKDLNVDFTGIFIDNDSNPDPECHTNGAAVQDENNKNRAQVGLEIMRLMLLPQLLIGLPVIFESFTLYETSLSPWHWLFLLSIALHYFLYNATSTVTVCYNRYKQMKTDKINKRSTRRNTARNDGGESDHTGSENGGKIENPIITTRTEPRFPQIPILPPQPNRRQSVTGESTSADLSSIHTGTERHDNPNEDPVNRSPHRDSEDSPSEFSQDEHTSADEVFVSHLDDVQPNPQSTIQTPPNTFSMTTYTVPVKMEQQQLVQEHVPPPLPPRRHVYLP